jgi:DNA ligase
MNTHLIRFIFVCLLPIMGHADLSTTKPRLAHANHYTENIDISQYLVSEKLDGVRGYWDGKNLYTRNGNLINTPQWFIKGWPNRKLDGELWIGRNHFEEVSGIVRRKQPNDKDWKNLKFMVFDLHPKAQRPNTPFEVRLKEINSLIKLARSKYLFAITQFQVSSHDELNAKLSGLVDKGAEGLMLHRRTAPYRAGRSDDILKLKPHWDAEVKVLAHLPGKGKYQGMMGALLVQGVSETQVKGKQFRIGTGFNDQERRTPPAVGSIITYRFQGYTKSGLPKFPSYLRLSE